MIKYVVAAQFDNGRLGNILFNFCNAYSYAIMNRLQFNGVVLEHVEDEWFIKLLKRNNIQIYKTLKDVPHLKETHIVKGYCQFCQILDKEKIYDLLLPSQEIKDEIYKSYGDLSDTIAIHIRRGDYVNNEYYYTLSKDDINRCLLEIPLYMDKNILIFSDDIDWCKKNLNPIPNLYYAEYESNKIPKHVFDLYTISLCKYNIISCSSFSWWAGYLNTHDDKMVIFMSPWDKFKREITNFICDGCIAIDRNTYKNINL